MIINHMYFVFSLRASSIATLWHADRERLLLRTPGPVPLGLAYVLLVETKPFSELVIIFPDYALRTSLGTFSINCITSIFYITQRNTLQEYIQKSKDNIVCKRQPNCNCHLMCVKSKVKSFWNVKISWSTDDAAADAGAMTIVLRTFVFLRTRNVQIVYLGKRCPTPPHLSYCLQAPQHPLSVYMTRHSFSTTLLQFNSPLHHYWNHKLILQFKKHIRIITPSMARKI